MDSGNSGSLQSSSGGDDEFDSRCGGAADSSPLSALLRQPPPSVPPGFGGGSLIYGLQELRTPPPLSHWCSMTAPLPAAAGADASPPSSLQGHGAPMAASAAADQADAPPPPAQRGSRKRARASRRAPTTVLTTDTSNFRAMVQEFTGIPAPPFAGRAAATARTTRFDHHLLFPLRTASAAGGTASAAALPQYGLLRPFAQKVQVHASSSATPYTPSFTSPSTSSPAPANISIIAPASTTAAPGTSTTALASSGDTYHHQQLAVASTSALLGMQRDHSSSSNYHSFHQSSSLGAGGDGKYAAHPAFDRGIAPPSSATRLQDPADFLGLTHDDVMVGSRAHAHLHPRNGGGDELSGMVGAASVVTGAGGCKATYSSSTRPLLERSRRNPSAGGVSTATTAAAAAPVTAAAAMRSQAGVVDSWVCTSD